MVRGPVGEGCPGEFARGYGGGVHFEEVGGLGRGGEGGGRGEVEGGGGGVQEEGFLRRWEEGC